MEYLVRMDGEIRKVFTARKKAEEYIRLMRPLYEYSSFSLWRRQNDVSEWQLIDTHFPLQFYGKRKL